MVLPFFFPAALILRLEGSGRGEEPSGGNALRLIQIRLTASSLDKILLGCQDKTLQARIADSSAIKAISFRRLRREIKGDQNSL